jgi:error-prone DNA polymerase
VRDYLTSWQRVGQFTDAESGKHAARPKSAKAMPGRKVRKSEWFQAEKHGYWTGSVDKFRDKLIRGMLDNGYTQEYAERTFRQIEGFGSYGFPESHAASFALIAYASSWMKCHHPEVFLCAILNAQPMGFYAPAQLVRDAREHGVEVRAVDINYSQYECTLEGTDGPCHAVRLGLGMARGLAEKYGKQITAARGDTPYVSVEELWRRAGVPVAALERLAGADAFRSLKISRRDASWANQGAAR